MGQALRSEDRDFERAPAHEPELLIVIGLTPNAYRQAFPFIRKMIQFTDGARVVSGDAEILAMK